MQGQATAEAELSRATHAADEVWLRANLRPAAVLFVAMMAGHVLLEVLSSFVIDSTNAGAGWAAMIGIPSFVLMIAICALELLVAGIQAYVFALLTSLYLNDAENLH